MTAPARAVLTGAQQSALELVADGYTYQQAGRILGVSPAAVANRMEHAMRTLGARTGPQAVLIACRVGLLNGRPQRHGDHAGYEAHRRRGENPKHCRLGCVEGERAHRAAMRARQTPQEAA